MSVHVHYDIAAIAAACDELRKSAEPLLHRDGSVGAQARLNYAALKAAHIALIEEVNRGTDLRHILDAVVTMGANLVMSAIQNMTDTAEQRQACFEHALNSFLTAIAAMETRTNIVGGGFKSVPPVTSGRA